MTPQDAERIVARGLYVMLKGYVSNGETDEESLAAERMIARLMANEPLTEVKLRFAVQPKISHE